MHVMQLGRYQRSNLGLDGITSGVADAAVDGPESLQGELGCGIGGILEHET